MFIFATLAPNGVVFQETHQPPPPMELLNVFLFFVFFKCMVYREFIITIMY